MEIGAEALGFGDGAWQMGAIKGMEIGEASSKLGGKR